MTRTHTFTFALTLAACGGPVETSTPLRIEGVWTARVYAARDLGRGFTAEGDSLDWTLFIEVDDDRVVRASNFTVGSRLHGPMVARGIVRGQYRFPFAHFTTITDDHFTPFPNLSFEGRVNESGSRLEGTFTNDAAVVPFPAVFER